MSREVENACGLMRQGGFSACSLWGLRIKPSGNNEFNKSLKSHRFHRFSRSARLARSR
jgi:hypothetical protein